MSHKTEIQVRFSDLDMVGHVHNAIYLNFFEQGRIDFLNEITNNDWEWTKKGIVLGRNEIDYIEPIQLHDEVFVFTRCEHVGNKSFTLSYDIFKRKDGNTILCTKGRTILVCMDFETNQSVPLFEEWKELLEDSIQIKR